MIDILCLLPVVAESSSKTNVKHTNIALRRNMSPQCQICMLSAVAGGDSHNSYSGVDSHLAVSVWRNLMINYAHKTNAGIGIVSFMHVDINYL